MTKEIDLSTHSVRPVVKITIPQRNVTSEQTQRTDASPEQATGRTKPSLTEKCTKQLRWECSSSSRNIKLQTPRPHSGSAYDRPEISETAIFPPIREVVRQKPSETSTDHSNLNKTNKDSTKY